MKLFSIGTDGKFSEFVQTPFHLDHEEAALEDWFESNPDGILEEGKLLIISRQVMTNLRGVIDLLGLDRNGNSVILEVKRNETSSETIARTLEYASFVDRLDAEQLEEMFRLYQQKDSVNLAECYRAYFELDPDEAIAFNNDQRIVIVGQNITPERRQTASYLCSKGIRVTCVEFSFFQIPTEGTRLLAQEIVVDKESDKPSSVISGSLPTATDHSHS